MAHLERDELLTGVREQVVGLVEIGDGEAQLTPADVDPTPVGEHACEVDLGVPLAQAWDGGGEHLERLVDAPRPCAQHGALQAGGLLQRLRAEAFDVVEVGERGGHRRSECQDTGERQVGVGLGLGVADLLGRGDRRMERRSGEIDLAEQASGASQDRQRTADAEVVALRPTSIGDGRRRDRNGRRIALDRCGELGELGEPVRGEPVRGDPGFGDRPDDTT